MKPTAVVDEMFPEGVGTYMDEDPGAGIIVDTNREGIHADFYNEFGDLFDDEDLQ